MSTVPQRPFKVLGIQQIAIGGPDKLRLQKLWVEMLGLEVTGNPDVEADVQLLRKLGLQSRRTTTEEAEACA